MRRASHIATLAAVLSASLAVPAAAQGTKAARAPRPGGRIARELQRGIVHLDRTLKTLKARKLAVPAEKRRQQVLPLLQAMTFQHYYGSYSMPRFFAAKLVLVNLTPQTVTLKRQDVSLKVGAKSYSLQDVPSRYRNVSVTIGNNSRSLSDLPQKKTLSVPPGRIGETWIVFGDLGKGNDLPTLAMSMTFGKRRQTLDVNDFARRRLGLQVERIGPRRSLGLLTISGRLNGVNVAALIGEMDKLLRAKPPVMRFVVRWTKSAEPFDSQLRQWLQQQAYEAGRPGTNPNGGNRSAYPPLPGSIRELHLAAIPGSSSGVSRSPYAGGTSRVHASAVEATSAALKSAYQGLSQDEIVREIEHGHPLTRAAALANGGGRLPAAKLPLLLKFADGQDPRLQRAALRALGEFGEEAAIARLVEYAHGNATPVGRTAVASLAASRFSAAHRALLELLKGEPPDSKKRIVKILAAHPRPIWSETIYRFVQDPSSGIGAEALRALGTIGHPRLVDVLEASLKGKDAAVRKEAFRQLAARSDERSERLALDYTLSRLKSGSPDPAMLQLLDRTKDQRAVPLLFARLDDVKSSGNRTSLINTLGRIGDQEAGQRLAKRYPRLKSSNEKAAALQALLKLRWPKFLDLAGEALLSNDSSLVRAACSGLQADASPRAVALLVEALQKSKQSYTWSYAANALGEIGTAQARAALVRVRDARQKGKVSYAISALRRIRQRSSSYQFVYQARRMLRDGDLKKTIQYCDLALKVDEDCPQALAVRGQARLRQKKYKQARNDLAAALKADPFDLYAATGMALLRVRDGKFRQAVKEVQDKRKYFNQYSEYSLETGYHVARVYSRALEAASKMKKSPQRDKLVKTYRSKAVEQLKQALKYGRNYSSGYGRADAKADPDFAPLKDLPEFKKLVAGAKKAKKRTGIKTEIKQ